MSSIGLGMNINQGGGNNGQSGYSDGGSVGGSIDENAEWGKENESAIDYVGGNFT